MSMRFERALLPAFLLVLIAVLAMPAHADVVLYSTGFESPTFTTGSIVGQDGWAKFGPGISTVENSFAKTGTQAVFVDGGTASQSGPYHSDTSTGTPFVDLSADLAIFTSTTQSEWQFAGLGPGLIGFLGGIDVLKDNSIKAITAGFPIIGIFPRATAFDATAWHHIDFLFNMVSQTYDISLDGTTLASGLQFCGDNGPCAGGPVPTYASGFFDSFGGANDSGYMDNYRVATVTGAVPEPSSILLLVSVMGGIAGLLRRKFSA